MRLPLSASLLLLLTACTSASTWQTPEPGAVDNAVAAALPQGTFTVTGTHNLGRDSKNPGPEILLDGYVDFGSAPDGADCSAEYRITSTPRDPSSPPELSSIRSVRTAGGPTWIRDESNPGKPGEWSDLADPDTQVILFLFIPAVMSAGLGVGVDEGAGTGLLCSIPTIARFMTLDGEKLLFDPKRADATTLTLTSRWLEAYIDAAGVTGSKRDKFLKQAMEMARPSFDTFMRNGRGITITTDPDGTVEILHRSPETNAILIHLTFTPTTPRAVERVNADTYFERVAVEIENSKKSGWEYVKDNFGL